MIETMTLRSVGVATEPRYRAGVRNFDAAAAQIARPTLMALAIESHRLVVDLTGVEFIDSAGLSLLCAVADRAATPPQIIGVSPRLERFLARVPRLVALAGHDTRSSVRSA